MIEERRAVAFSGYLVFGIGFVLLVADVLNIVRLGGQSGTDPATAGLAIVISILATLALGAVWIRGMAMVNPNEALVLQLFGAYAGSVREPGFHWVNPLTSRRRVSARIRSFETEVLKVNDRDGNPIEIAAVVVWQVQDSARAIFQVDRYVEFIRTQAESAIRHVATSYPYDAHDDLPSLRAGRVLDELVQQVQERVGEAGLGILEVRISRLSYAPEIAHAMLQRQQANAVVAARQRIVEGAVGMVEMALDRLSERGVVELDEERKAAMVSNLLVVLCSERNAQPVVNAGSLYQ